MDIEFIPEKATDLFSVLDVAMNRPYKQKLREMFTMFCADQIKDQLMDGVALDNVKIDLRASYIKPRASRWMVEAWQHLKTNEKQFISGGWRKVEENIAKYLLG